MVLLPLIQDGIVALVAMTLLPSSSWRLCHCCNGVVVIIDVVALVARAHHQAGVVPLRDGIVAVNAQASLPLLQWQLSLLS
jgi:hypothetical protein